jgi:hypothetical protein
MQIFGRPSLSCEQLWELYSRLAASEAIWHQSSFVAAAKDCGLKRVKQRAGYCSFGAANHTTGQAQITTELIEEMRFFIGSEPRNLDPADWEKDQHKHALLAKDYCAMFASALGPSIQVNNNDMFEYHGFRVRVLASQAVWVVVSKLAIVQRLPNDWWAVAVRNAA